MKSRKQKTLDFLRAHRFPIWVIVSTVLYLGLRYVNRELAKSGIEFILYPTIDVLIERFVIGE